jgi:uncharacterized membrane protein
MQKKIREILLTQYIGSILVALLALQALIEIVAMIFRIASWPFNYRRSVSLGSPLLFPWDSLIFSLVSVALYVLIAYVLARWLYPQATPDDTETGVPLQSETEQP